MTKFSVVLSVRNGWPYIKECVESVLAQTYPHFDLIVLDNRSTDNTLPWLKTLTDDRIRLTTSAADLSIVESWGRVKDVEKQEYMTLIGHDDLLDRDFLRTIKTLIDRFPDCTLYQTGARFIDAEGKVIRTCRDVPERETAAQFLEARLTYQRDVFGTGYVMRSADYDRTGGLPAFEKLFFADDALWLKMIGNFCKAADPAEHCAVRIHPKSESASLPSIWEPGLTGLGQFSKFLDVYLAGNADARAVYARHGTSFMLSRHRAFYMFALIEACQHGRTIDPKVTERFETSLARLAPSLAGTLRRSAAVAAIATLNASPFRAAVPWMWRAFNNLRHRFQ
ncbi:glycosyltransferase [Bradyrhizobium lablabi]|uniref:glycosyltransferase family 2 protein n=1 Tax=Bradyrhizobium lablabi TaxID=722472 RepID=UPI001BA66DC4|nr:glycosyltransferase [Bradyrhizobium lablabi]MBR1120199.1 glycosyltransferase [Bradyrhizobium lablabi]